MKQSVVNVIVKVNTVGFFLLDSSGLKQHYDHRKTLSKQSYVFYGCSFASKIEILYFYTVKTTLCK